MIGLQCLLLVGLLGVICQSADVVVAPENGIDKLPAQDSDGRITMGVVSPCDDGQTNITIDYNRLALKRVCKCIGGKRIRTDFRRVQHLRKYKGKKGGDHPTSEPVVAEIQNETPATNTPAHVCTTEPIVYDNIIPTSGVHRPLWPKFGEYIYLPPQRWVHSLEHGAVVFLYNPCEEKEEVNRLRTIAASCLYKHIITPHPKLPPALPFAVVSWGWRLQLPSINETEITNFIKDKALTGPETRVVEEGQYDIGFIRGPVFKDGEGYEGDREDICPDDPKGTPSLPTEVDILAETQECKDLMSIVTPKPNKDSVRGKGKGRGAKGNKDRGKGRGRGPKGNKDLGKGKGKGTGGNKGNTDLGARKREREKALQDLFLNKKQQRRNKNNKRNKNRQ